MSEAAIFEDLIQHERWLKRLACKLVVGDEAASELVQETLVRAIATPPADLTRPRAWLETVLRNLATSLHRRRSPETLDALEASEVFSTSATRPEHALERFEAARAVSAAVDALPEREKQVILMYWQEGLEVGAIARSLELTESAVRKQLASAHEHLRRKLRHDYGDGGWAPALAPLIAVGAPDTAAPVSAGASSTAFVSALVVASICTIAIPVWFAATSGADGDSPALSLAGTAAPGEPPAEAHDLVPGAAGPAERSGGPRPDSAPWRAPHGAATSAPAGPVAAAAKPEAETREPRGAEIPLAGVRGWLSIDGERVAKWAARLRQLEGCVEDCTVRSRMEGTRFDLRRRSFGHHKLVLDSEVVDGVYSTLRYEFALARGVQLDLEFAQETTRLTVTGVPARYSELYAYWTDGVGTEFMQGVPVQNGKAEFPSAPVGRVDIKVPERIAAPSGWPVLGRTRLSADVHSTFALPR